VIIVNLSMEKDFKCILIPNQCRAARELLGWKQDDLAKKSEVAQATIGFFERGERMPHKRTLKAIRSVFEESGIEFENTDTVCGLRLITKK